MAGCTVCRPHTFVQMLQSCKRIAATAMQDDGCCSHTKCWLLQQRKLMDATAIQVDGCYSHAS